MDITSTCPACGAQLTIDSGEHKVQCPFCGNRFDVDMSGVEPAFKVAGPSTEMPDVPEPEPAAPPVFASTPPPPPTPEFVPAHKQAGQPGGILNSPRIPASIRRQPVWAIIAVIFGILLCMAFACLALAAVVFQRIF